MFSLSNVLDTFEIRIWMRAVHLANVSKTKFSSKTYKGSNLLGAIKISVALVAASMGTAQEDLFQTGRDTDCRKPSDVL